MFEWMKDHGWELFAGIGGPAILAITVATVGLVWRAIARKRARKGQSDPPGKGDAPGNGGTPQGGGPGRTNIGPNAGDGSANAPGGTMTGDTYVDKSIHYYGPVTIIGPGAEEAGRTGVLVGRHVSQLHQQGAEGVDWPYELFQRFTRGGLAGVPLIGGFLAEAFDLYRKSRELGAPDINAIARLLGRLQVRCDNNTAVVKALTDALAGGEVEEEFREPLEELVGAVNNPDDPDKRPPRFRQALKKIERRFRSDKEFGDHYAEKFEQILAELAARGVEHGELKKGQDVLEGGHGRIEAKIDQLAGVGRPPGPGHLCNLPPRNEAFTGREEELDKLHAALESGGPVAILRDLRGLDKAAVRQVIEGLGGVGKTQLAVQYGHCHVDDYAIRWLVRAETPSDAKLSLVELGVLLEPELAKVADIDQQVARTLQLLNSADSALLIYDDAGQPEDIAGLYPTAAGHVLITSRYTDWQTIARAISLETFTEDEALEYLRRRELTDGEDELKALAQRLGHLPLGLAMAAGYMVRQHVSAGEYLGEYEGDQAVLTAAPLPQDYGQAETLPAVFERSFTAAGEQDALAMELLEALAFLAPDDIPLFVLDYPEAFPRASVSAGLAEALGDERRRRELVSTLVDYSLVSRADDTLSIHRLTRDVLRDRLRADEALREQRLYAAIELVNAQVIGDPSMEVDRWPSTDALMPHIRALRDAMAGVPPADWRAPWPRVLNQFGLHCQTRAEYAEAKACYELALKIDEATHGVDHPIVGIRVSNLGAVLRVVGDLKGAKECYERALKIDEATYGPDHPGVAQDVNNYGGVLRDMGDLAGAKKCFERAAAIWTDTLGPDDPNVASAASNLSLALLETGDLAGAKECAERAEAIWSNTLGPEHPNVAFAVNNLALVLRDMGDLPGARKRYEQALKIDEAAYGPDHPEVAMDLNNLGGGLVQLGRPAEARPLLERALAIFTDKLGPEHPSTQTAMGWVERVRREMGE